MWLGIGKLINKSIPPGWQGWISHQYDDVPSEITNNFVNHSYIKPHRENESQHPLHYRGYGSIANPDRMEFLEETAERRAQKWIAPGCKLLIIEHS